ncbi:MAG: glycosyltransferase N-terminal domain-containing protein [Planctomycetota bacterium]|nr:glycosyltransferase N-terminal domain-containing protein [Planctomycetota bacterium]
MSQSPATDPPEPIPDPVRADPFPGITNALLYGAYDLLWLGVALLLSPWWLVKAALRKPFRRMVLERLTLGLAYSPPATAGRTRVLVHGVSVGEIMASRSLVAALADTCEVVVSASTNTGKKVARQQLPNLRVVRFPLDPSPCIRRFLARIRPEHVILMELEVWPNFLKWSNRYGTPVAIVNGRITDNSLQNYQRFSRSLPQFQRVSLFAVQDETYGARFRQLYGTDRRVVVTGNIKVDGLEFGAVEHDQAFRELEIQMGWNPEQVVLLAGSTHYNEEPQVYQAFSRACPSARIVLVPRHPDRAADVVEALAQVGAQAQLLTALRAGTETLDITRPLIVDTVGELGRIYSLATVVFVGGSLVPHGGQNMLEPVARGRAVLYGPHTDNFRGETALLEAAGGSKRVADAADLEATVRELIDDPARRQALAQAGFDVARAQGGATDRTIEALSLYLGLGSPGPKNT